MPFEGSHLWQLRQLVGSRLIVTAAAVAVVLDGDDRVLLIKRGDTGHWALPGGSAEPGQTFAQTAAAEALEETGLTIEPADLTAFASLSDERWTHFTFPNGDEVHSFNLCFAARQYSGRLTPDGVESLRTEFYDLDELPEPMLPMSERVLELYALWNESGTFQAA